MGSPPELQSMYVRLVDNLNCIICHDVLSDARDLYCGHTYCLACLQELITLKGWKKTIQCCLCRRETAMPGSGVSGLRQNYKLNCIIEEQKEIMKKIRRDAASAEPDEEQVQIWVRDLEGKSHSVIVRLTDTADTLKRQVAKKTGIPPNVQRLLFRSTQLEGDINLASYGVRLHSTVELVIPLTGGYF